MLSISQRAKLLSVIPTTLSDYNVKILRKDRFQNDDYEFPSMRLNILSEGIRVSSTAGPIRKNFDGDNGDVEQYLGHLQQASVSVTLMAESETPGTDQSTPEILDQMLYDLQQEIEIWRLGLYWPDDKIKVIPGSGKVTYLPPFMAKAADEHWIYPAVIDFRVQYEFSVIDPTPNIHVIGYDFGLPDFGMPVDTEPMHHTYFTDIHPPWYQMDICMLGWKSSILADVILKGGSSSKIATMDIILIND